MQRIELLRKIAKADRGLMAEVRNRRDAQGGITQLTVRSFICCYSAAQNEPFKGNQWRYSYLEKWDDLRIKEIGRRQCEETLRQLRLSATPP
jgi:hypothetical protein